MANIWPTIGAFVQTDNAYRDPRVNAAKYVKTRCEESPVVLSFFVNLSEFNFDFSEAVSISKYGIK